MTTIIELNNVDKSFLTDEIETLALSNIEVAVRKGEFVSITGPSGCGKSTLLALLGLLDTASSGQYILNQKNTVALDKRERARIRNKEIGFIFQSFNLISNLDVYENVELPLTYRSDLSASDIKHRVNEALEKVEMGHRDRHFPSQLSGGQQQRVAIARALAGSPSIILADEPTGNLDSKNAQIVMDILHELHREGATICMVTHDAFSADTASRRISLFDGRIVEDTQLNTQAA